VVHDTTVDTAVAVAEMTFSAHEYDDDDDDPALTTKLFDHAKPVADPFVDDAKAAATAVMDGSVDVTVEDVTVAPFATPAPFAVVGTQNASAYTPEYAFSWIFAATAVAPTTVMPFAVEFPRFANAHTLIVPDAPPPIRVHPVGVAG